MSAQVKNGTPDPEAQIATSMLNARRDWAIFSLTVLALSVLGIFCAATLPKGSVWDNHLADGLLFMSGAVSVTPAYPIWGYSLLAGLFKENVIVFQMFLIVIILSACYASQVRHFHTLHFEKNWLTLITSSPVLAALSIAPFIFLSSSYFSNAIPQLLAFAAAWILYISVQEDRPKGSYIGAGVLFGIGYNFRSELLILVGLLVIGCMIFILRRRRPFLNLLLFGATFFVAILPWLAYTNATLGEPRLSSTNGGGTMYEGLGMLPRNPWKIEESDAFVERIAAEMKHGSPWSKAADTYFKAKYIEAAYSHPLDFTRRILYGWRYMLTQGVYLPKLRLFLANTDRDNEILHFVDESFRSMLGLNVHEEEMARLASIGIDEKLAKSDHYLVIGLEYIIRIIYAGLLLALLLLCAILVWKDKLMSLASTFFICLLGFLLFGSGLIHTNPRHTTIALPILLFILCILCRTRISLAQKVERPDY